MKLIELSKQGWKHKGKYFAMVDDEDFERVNQYDWQVAICYWNIYAKGLVKGKETYLHPFILKTNSLVDHINGNGLDDQKHNLRITSTQKNAFNQKIRSNNTSGYKGVSWYRRLNKWVARINIDYKGFTLGYFSDPVEAARAYNKKAVELFGEFARLNQIGSD